MQKYSYHAFTVSMHDLQFTVKLLVIFKGRRNNTGHWYTDCFFPFNKTKKIPNYLENTPHMVLHTLGDNFKSRALLLVRASGGCLTSYSKGEGDETANQPTNKTHTACAVGHSGVD